MKPASIKRGRPPMRGNERSRTLQVRLREWEYQVLVDEAGESGRSLSDEIRDRLGFGYDYEREVLLGERYQSNQPARKLHEKCQP